MCFFLDNASKDNTVKYLKSKEREVLSKPKRTGLTHSYNLAYRIFKEKNYDSIFFSNNDVILNKISMERMIKHSKVCALVCPLTSKKGAGSGEGQSVGRYYKISEDIATDPKEHNAILDLLIESEPIKMNRCYNGFFFGINRDIIKCEHSPDNLFNPKLINIHQESDLYERIKKAGVSTHLCTDTFIFHYKAKTIGVHGKTDRNKVDF
jgi:GT2 family glycosyltransferase